MRQASRYSIGGSPTIRLSLAKKAERNIAASVARSATVQPCAGRACMARKAATRRSSESPRATLGTLAMIQAVLPQFRERRSGVIINVTSSATLKPLPLISVYRASKAAVNALTESLAVEMKPFGVRVHIVLPGRSPTTSFSDNAMPHLRGLDNPDYKPLIEGMIANFREDTGPVTHAGDVAEAVWQVASDPSVPLRIAAGKDAVQWMAEAS